MIDFCWWKDFEDSRSGKYVPSLSERYFAEEWCILWFSLPETKRKCLWINVYFVFPCMWLRNNHLLWKLRTNFFFLKRKIVFSRTNIQACMLLFTCTFSLYIEINCLMKYFNFNFNFLKFDTCWNWTFFFINDIFLIFSIFLVFSTFSFSKTRISLLSFIKICAIMTAWRKGLIFFFFHNLKFKLKHFVAVTYIELISSAKNICWLTRQDKRHSNNTGHTEPKIN